MKFLLNIQCDNAAFHGQNCPDEEHTCPAQADEIGQLLGSIGHQIRRRGLPDMFETIRDSNGNDVGRFAIKPDSYQP